MKYIELTQNKKALIDDEDFEWLNQWKWSTLQGKYAHRNTGKGKWIRMHRLIMEAPSNIDIDHINGNGFDNRKINLRFCSPSQNLSNRTFNKNSKSRVKDVFWQPDRQKWFVQVMKDGKKYNGGRFSDLSLAIKKRNELIGQLHGEFSHV